MKRHGNQFEKIISFDNLLEVSNKALRGKKNNARVARFYFDLEKELLCLREELLNKTYNPRPLRKFKIREPKAREISSSDFRDRVVHHAICNILEPILERSFIHDSYACRIGKGTHKAVIKAQKLCRKHHYFLKCDIKKYFASIDHAILKHILIRKLKDPDLIWLLNTIIVHAESGQSGKGIPIGSLTSQHFANMYLDRLDHYIKDSLGIKSYLRYMDDFIIFGDEKIVLHLLSSSIRTFLYNELKLELKDKATILAPVMEGLPFLGFRIFPNVIRLKNENKRIILNKLKLRDAALRNGNINEEKYSQSVMSITEHLKMGNTFNLRKDIFSKLFF